MQPPPITDFSDLEGNPIHLVLYQYASCPFCRMVQSALRDLNYQISQKDTLRDKEARMELNRVGGKNQVPCLFINGKPLYESQDIVHFLRTQIRPIPKPEPQENGP
ncbi:MAG: glutaredoxin [Myxococcota bacterium]|nr:glutaredoxin [Myxococcota bacterium]